MEAIKILEAFAGHGPVWILVALLLTIIGIGGNKLLKVVQSNTKAMTTLTKSIDELGDKLVVMEKNFEKSVRHEHELTRSNISHKHN